MIVRRVCTRLEYRYLHLEQLPFCSCCVFNILRVRSPKKVKNRGGLTNRQLNTYPSFLPQYYSGNENMVISRYCASCFSANLKISEQNIFLLGNMAENLF